ncbi:MAG TPA: hypothetical protein PLO89_08480 [Spirochaetota bacterium]|nr:hypothetical protein [Spirochaetota bacterium]
MIKKIIYFIFLLLYLCSCKNKTDIPLNLKNANIDELSFDDFSKWLNASKKHFLKYGKNEEFIEFLAEKNASSQIYSSYLNFVISTIYWELNQKETALSYILETKEDCYDMIYENQKIGYIIALKVVNSEADFYLKEKMYKLLLDKYKESIDIPYVMNELAKLYKGNLDIKKAIAVMEDIIELSNKNKNVEENVNLAEIKEEIDFFYSKKNWIYKDLQKLIIAIKKAVLKKDADLLYSYASKKDFKIILSQNENDKNWSYFDLGIEYRFSDRIIFSGKLEDFSNDKEAFLKTENWDFPQMSTWYLYFKKIYYPYDEKIDGGWEWKGIYFGNYF